MSKNTLLIVLIVIGLLAALVSFRSRYRAEARNKRVEIVIDWAAAQALAHTTSLTIPKVLEALKTSSKEKIDANGHRTPGNGGITTVSEVQRHLAHVDGVMLGRAAYHDPYLLARIEAEFNGDALPQRDEVLRHLRTYVEAELARALFPQAMDWLALGEATLAAYA